MEQKKKLDKSIEPYLDYLRKLNIAPFRLDYIRGLVDQKFTGKIKIELPGKIKLELNWHLGGITNVNQESEPVPGVTAVESVRL